MTELTIEERVANGVKLLDEKRPGWYKKIDLAKLNINDCVHCIVGQLIGNYWPENLGLMYYYAEYSHGVERLTEDIGRELAYGELEADARLLTEEWKRVIELKRSSAVTADSHPSPSES